jgi:hypothetical protein
MINRAHLINYKILSDLLLHQFKETHCAEMARPIQPIPIVVQMVAEDNTVAQTDSMFQDANREIKIFFRSIKIFNILYFIYRPQM